MNSKGDPYEKSVLFEVHNHPRYFSWWSQEPIPIEKCNKKWQDSFLILSLGLNSLPRSCDIKGVSSNISNILFPPLLLNGRRQQDKIWYLQRRPTRWRRSLKNMTRSSQVFYSLVRVRQSKMSFPNLTTLRFLLYVLVL